MSTGGRRRQENAGASVVTSGATFDASRGLPRSPGGQIETKPPKQNSGNIGTMSKLLGVRSGEVVPTRDVADDPIDEIEMLQQELAVVHLVGA